MDPKEYKGTMPACFEKGLPRCPAEAVIPTMTVETDEGIKKLSNTVVHVVQNNATYYVDDKHRITEICTEPVERNDYDFDNNPEGFRGQIVFDYATNRAAYFNNAGQSFSLVTDNVDFNALSNRPKYNGVQMTSSTNIPLVPTRVSELANDAHYQTESDVQTTVSNAVATHNTSPTAHNDIRQALADEVSARTAGVKKVADDLADEITARTNADTALEAADTALGTRITNETTARQNADSALQSDITAEETARKAADKTLQDNIDAEANTRSSADSTLQSNITAEATARGNADTALGTRITDETTNRTDADTALGGRIDTEITNRTNADTALGGRIDTEITNRTNADTAIENKLNRTVLYDLEMETDANNVTFVEDKVNLKTGGTSTERDVIPAASRTTAGTISASEYISLVDAEEKITALLEGAVAIDNLPANPTQAQLTAAWKTATGKDELINRASIYDSANQLVHTYYTNVSEWEDSPAGGQITIDQFTNSAAGIIKGSTTDGNVSANLDGTGTVSGWTALKNTVAGKQDALTAGNNISISGSTISATDTTYSAGTGLSLTGTTFAVDTTTIAQKSDIPTVNNATLTIQKNGTDVQTFTANSASNKTANITVPTKTSELTNDSSFPVDASYVHTDNNFTTTLKNKLDGIAAGAEVNQNAFSNVKVGGTTVAADSKTDTLELVAGSNVTLTPDATNDKVTIAATDTNTTYTFANGTNGFTVTPSGGTAQTVTVTPSIADATTSAHGLMSAADKTKLNGIASGAEVNVQSDWSVTDNSSDAFIKNKPTIPTVNNGTLTIQKNGTNVATFTANQSGNATANITVPTKVTDLTDAANYVAKDGDFYVTGEGSNFSMTGTSQNVYADLKVKGDTQQTTYTGKNLVNTAAMTMVSGGTDITFAHNDDGSFTLNGTSSDRYNNIRVVATDLIAPLVGQEVTLSVTTTGTGSFNNFGIKNGGGTQDSLTCTPSTTPKTGTITATTSGTYSFDLYFSNGITFSNYTVKLQCEKGSSATAFEPYVGGTASPNPDYPQEVEVVTGRQMISSCGKNLLNINDNLITGTSNQLHSEPNEDGSFHMYGTASSTWANVTNVFPISLEPGTYQLSVTQTYTHRIYIHLNFEDGTGGDYIIAPGNTTATLTLSKKAINVRVNLSILTSGTTYDENIYLQLEKGSAATPFEPYLGKEIEVNLGKNLFDKDNPNILEAYIDATTSVITSNNLNRIVWIPCEPNTTYTVQRVATPSWNRGVAWTETTPANGVQTYGYVQGNADTLTITTGATAKYLVYRFYQSNSDSSTTLANVLSSVQIEKGSTATSYAPYFTPIELCKIGTRQDYLYPSGGKWYVHKEIGIKHFSDVNSFVFSNGCFQTNYKFPNDKVAQTTAFSDYFTFNSVQTSITSVLVNGEFGWNTSNYLTAKNTALTTKTEWETWLSTNDPSIYYALATPTDTEITNPLLVAQLDGLWRNLQSGTNTTNVNVEGDLPAVLGVTAFTNTLASAMAGLNERMNRLPAIPQITMTTTDPGEGQTLEDNHFIAVYSN